MKQKVVRKTLTGSMTPFTFDVKACSFFVMNFSDDDAYVSFEDGVQDPECYKLPSMFAATYFYNDYSGYYTDTIYIKGTGEIEVEPLNF